MLTAFRDKSSAAADACSLTYNTDVEFKVAVSKLGEMRREQTALLEKALLLEEENCRLAELILEETA